MSGQKLDEEAIFEVASAIQDPAIQAKYLRQVCHDERLQGRLEGRLKYGRRRWQFSLRTLLIIMLLGGALSASVAISIRTVVEARQMAIDSRLRARHAEQAALQARQEAEQQRAIAEQIAAQATENARLAKEQLQHAVTATEREADDTSEMTQ